MFISLFCGKGGSREPEGIWSVLPPGRRLLPWCEAQHMPLLTVLTSSASTQGKSSRLTCAKPFLALKASAGHNGQTQLYLPGTALGASLACGSLMRWLWQLDLILALTRSGIAPSN